MSKEIFAIDPGNTLSGVVSYIKDDKECPVVDPGKVDNLVVVDKIKEFIARYDPDSGSTIAIEFPQPRGQLASKELFKMIFWVGRFYEIARALGLPDRAVRLCNRLDVKMHLCGDNRVKDGQVRQAVIDRFGGRDSISSHVCQHCKGKGGAGRGKERKYCGNCGGSGEVTPGVLYRVSEDAWQALALAITFEETGKYIDTI
jgi:hypothetical protein